LGMQGSLKRTSLRTFTTARSTTPSGWVRAVSQLLWSGKDREEWFSLRENHDKAYRFGLHQLRNC
jgi:hypothetical protein